MHGNIINVAVAMSLNPKFIYFIIYHIYYRRTFIWLLWILFIQYVYIEFMNILFLQKTLQLFHTNIEINMPVLYIINLITVEALMVPCYGDMIIQSYLLQRNKNLINWSIEWFNLISGLIMFNRVFHSRWNC